MTGWPYTDEFLTGDPDYLHPQGYLYPQTRPQDYLHPGIKGQYFDFAPLPLDVAAMVAMSMGIVDLSSLVQTCRSLHVHLMPILVRHKRSTAELIDAVLVSNRVDVKRSLNTGADPDVYRLGRPLLHIALELSSNRVGADIVLLLLKSGCNPNSMNRFGETALYQVRAGDGRGRNNAYQNMVDLLDAGADPNHTSHSGDRTLLEIWRNDTHFLSLLLESGCNPNTPGCDGYTILCHAVDDGNTRAVETLLEAGADPNVFTSYDMGDKIERVRKSVPLLHRALHQSKNIALTLLQSSHIICNPNVSNLAGYTALYEADVEGDIADVEMLLTYNADPNIATPGLCWTPLHIATYMNDKPLVKLL